MKKMFLKFPPLRIRQSKTINSVGRSCAFLMAGSRQISSNKAVGVKYTADKLGYIKLTIFLDVED